MKLLMKNTLFILLSLGFTLCSSSNLLADYECLAEVSYSWTASGAEEESSESFRSVSSIAPEEQSSKDLLEEQAIRVKMQAMDECRRQHENLSGCIGSRHQQNASIIRNLTFSGRKEFEKAISEDCKARQGKCKQAVLSEPKCQALEKSSRGAGKAGH